MIVKTPGSQMGSPAAAEEGGGDMGGEKCESGERSEVQRTRFNLGNPEFTREIEKFTAFSYFQGDKKVYYKTTTPRTT